MYQCPDDSQSNDSGVQYHISYVFNVCRDPTIGGFWNSSALASLNAPTATVLLFEVTGVQADVIDPVTTSKDYKAASDFNVRLSSAFSAGLIASNRRNAGQMLIGRSTKPIRTMIRRTAECPLGMADMVRKNQPRVFVNNDRGGMSCA